MSPQRHERYYFDDGNVIFLVQDTLFNVHRYFLKRDSPVFQAMFSPPSGVSGEGESDDNPIILEGVKSANFANLLSCLYPSQLGKAELSYLECTSVLDLALKWELDTVRDFVAQHIATTCTLAEQVATARRLNRHQWYLSASKQLCQRARPLTLEEAQVLGIIDTARISEARERSRGGIRIEKGIHAGFRWEEPKELFTHVVDHHSPAALESFLQLPKY